MSRDEIAQRPYAKGAIAKGGDVVALRIAERAEDA